jgi:hypothetical protein
LAIALTAASALPASAREPEPAFPDSIELDTPENRLIKLGEYRFVYRMFFKLYDVALYAAPGATAKDVLAAQTHFRLQFRYLREIKKSIILESADKMLRKNLSPAELRQISERVDRINEAYRTVKDGDRSSLTYQPDVGTTLAINGKPQITIEGEDFAHLYVKIWLGEQPISQTLRQSVLGLAE